MHDNETTNEELQEITRDTEAMEVNMDKYKEVAREIISDVRHAMFSLDSEYTKAIDRSANYLRQAFPSVPVAHSVRELVDCIREPKNAKILDVINHELFVGTLDEAAELIQSYIDGQADKWEPIETAPWDTEVLLKGVSGYTTYSRFIINGYRVHDWHNGTWNNVGGDRLSDNGWEPTHWQTLSISTKGE